MNVLVVLGFGAELAGLLVALPELRTRAAALSAYRQAGNVTRAHAGVTLGFGIAANGRVDTGMERTLEQRLGVVETRVKRLPEEMRTIPRKPRSAPTSGPRVGPAAVAECLRGPGRGRSPGGGHH